MKKFTNKKGFTLVEMLIVVAIIAVLAAVAIPSGLNALDKAHEATDEANLRTAKTLAVAEAAKIAETDGEDAASYYFAKSTSTLEAWTTTIPDAETGLSKANDEKVIKVDIDKYGGITAAWVEP